MIRKLAVLAVIAGVAAGAVVYVRRARTAPRADVPTYTVVEDTLVRKVTAEGNLRAVKATPLTVPKTSNDWGAMKVAWLAAEGTRVKEGDVVVKFDRSEPEKQLRDGEADLEAANARLRAEQIKSGAAMAARDAAATLADKELAQAQQFKQTDAEIFSRNQIIESEIDGRLAGAKRDHAAGAKEVERNLARSKTAVIGVERQKAELAIRHAQKALESMEIRAPHAGIFVLQRNWRGEIPKIGEQLWPGQAVGEIPLLDAMEVEAFVLELDGSGLAEGQPAEVVIEARPEQVFRGKVRLVDKLAKPRIGKVPIQYFTVAIALDKTDPEVMKPGQRVRATLVLDEARALLVPRQAVLNKDGKNFVYRRTPRGEFELVPVELGASTSGRVVVKQGLAAGDRIAMRDPTRSLDQALGSGSSDAPAQPEGRGP